MPYRTTVTFGYHNGTMRSTVEGVGSAGHRNFCLSWRATPRRNTRAKKYRSLPVAGVPGRRRGCLYATFCGRSRSAGRQFSFEVSLLTTIPSVLDSRPLTNFLRSNHSSLETSGQAQCLESDAPAVDFLSSAVLAVHCSCIRPFHRLQFSEIPAPMRFPEPPEVGPLVLSLAWCASWCRSGATQDSARQEVPASGRRGGAWGFREPATPARARDRPAAPSLPASAKPPGVHSGLASVPSSISVAVSRRDHFGGKTTASSLREPASFRRRSFVLSPWTNILARRAPPAASTGCSGIGRVRLGRKGTASAPAALHASAGDQVEESAAAPSTMEQPMPNARALPTTAEQKHDQQQQQDSTSRNHDAPSNLGACPLGPRWSRSHDRPRASLYSQSPSGSSMTADALHEPASSKGLRAELDQRNGAPAGTAERAKNITQSFGRDQHASMLGVSFFGYSWPILLAVFPPLGSLCFGSVEAWSDFFSLVLIGIFLYHIIKVPWELYYAAAGKAPITDSTGTPASEDDSSAPPNPRREAARRSLWYQERASLGLVLLSPVFGGGTLYFLKSSLSNYDKYFSDLSILLFVLAASFRPLAHVLSLSKNRAAMLQQRVHFPYTEVGVLRQRIDALEVALASLKETVATSQREVAEGTTKAVVPQLQEISKALKRSERRDGFLRGYSEERFQTLESRMREQENGLQLIAAQIAALRSMRTQQTSTRVDAASPGLPRGDWVAKEVERPVAPRASGGVISSALSLMATTALLPVTSVAWVCAFFVHMLPFWFFASRPKLRTLDERFLDDEGVGGLCRDQRRGRNS
ncbi:MAG: hypothetical protein BJ554DRAFT_2553 [Olpidium bornovanus]|uniref:Uncharacterized protein n=1 Tax=Olpidium bornovanus TaxID=278681 RepID=A0A8H8A161_9FUNG|nr:MAG: hypothetical protein BJ554DRAFT_2553 [Olpidium bornovanus]